MRVYLRNKCWKLVFKRLTSHRGYCDSPDAPSKSIEIDSKLKGEERLEVLIHEMLHASGWILDEEWVASTAHDIARILWRLGYRHAE